MTKKTTMRVLSTVACGLLTVALSSACGSPKEVPAEAGAGDVPAAKLAAAAAPAAKEVRETEGGSFEERLFPPELVMQHQGELAVTTAQRDQLLAEIERHQASTTRLKWDLQAENEKLAKMLEPDRVDASKVQATAARVAELDTKLKEARLLMLLQVKGLLTSEQQQALRAIRARAPATGRAPEGSASAAPPAHPPTPSNPPAKRASSRSDVF